MLLLCIYFFQYGDKVKAARQDFINTISKIRYQSSAIFISSFHDEIKEERLINNPDDGAGQVLRKSSLTSSAFNSDHSPSEFLKYLRHCLFLSQPLQDCLVSEISIQL